MKSHCGRQSWLRGSYDLHGTVADERCQALLGHGPGPLQAHHRECGHGLALGGEVRDSGMLRPMRKGFPEARGERLTIQEVEVAPVLSIQSASTSFS